MADAMAPNHTELQLLVGREIETLEEAVTACREIIARGPKLVLVKHLLDRNSPADRFNMLVVTEREAWMGQRPLYPFARQPVGVGDLTSAVFVARTLLGDSIRAAFEHTLAAVNAVVKSHLAGRTLRTGTRRRAERNRPAARMVRCLGGGNGVTRANFSAIFRRNVWPPTGCLAASGMSIGAIRRDCQPAVL